MIVGGLGSTTDALTPLLPHGMPVYMSPPDLGSRLPKPSLAR